MNRIIIGGRNSNCDFILPDQYASKQHLQILITEKNEVYVVDLNSTSGTTINGHLIKPNTAIKLNDYDIVRAADTLIPWKKFLNSEPLQKHMNGLDYNEYQQTIRKQFDETSGSYQNKKKKFIDLRKIWRFLRNFE
jgi:pSer/pThr/pTyr-binding forkhead associated (FHA) protein